MVISLPSNDREGLIPARGIGGDLEISDDGEILSEEGDLTCLSSTIVGVLKGVAENISQQFHKRIIPDSSIIENKFSVDDDVQTRNTLSLINVLVSNMDYGKNKIALYEMFFRVIGKSRSSKESALYLTHLLRLDSELAEKLKQIELSKSIYNLLTPNSNLGNRGEQEVVDLIEKVKKRSR